MRSKINSNRRRSQIRVASVAIVAALVGSIHLPPARAADIQTDFVSPPDSAKPWVYWYFMDGNSSRAA